MATHCPISAYLEVIVASVQAERLVSERRECYSPRHGGSILGGIDVLFGWRNMELLVRVLDSNSSSAMRGSLGAFDEAETRGAIATCDRAMVASGWLEEFVL